MNSDKPLKKLPPLLSDEAAERFLEEEDLSKYDLSQFKPVRFEFETKDACINMRLPETLLAAVRQAAAARSISYQRFVRQVLERAISRAGARRR